MGSNSNSYETIVAQATPPGRGGIGIVRISGEHVTRIAKAIVGQLPAPRYAAYRNFMGRDGSVIDQGIVLYFPKPHSFTGEDVIEFQGHGGQWVLDCLIKRILALGARLARPGEFSERAFLNNKIDLAQAEAIADLIDSGSRQAAQAAMRSLQGAFSNRINELVDSVIKLRTYIEAAIDFPEEEVDFLDDDKLSCDLKVIQKQLQAILANAKQGAILQEGMTVVLAGEPNVGKSTLFNQLSGKSAAIVTEIAGTTRDVMYQDITIDGLPFRIIDTAGLREGMDIVEQEGVRRARNEIKGADKIILMVDATQTNNQAIVDLKQQFFPTVPLTSAITLIVNKIDLVNKPPLIQCDHLTEVIYLSAKTGQGLTLLKNHLKETVGYDDVLSEGCYMARRRHLNALVQANEALSKGLMHLQQMKAGELLAEELRYVQQHLAEITGEFGTEDLLEQIFSSFCIGK